MFTKLFQKKKLLKVCQLCEPHYIEMSDKLFFKLIIYKIYFYLRACMRERERILWYLMSCFSSYLIQR